MSELLTPEFVRELDLLRRRLATRARSGALGDRAANRRGGSAEFVEHRPYERGDDPRRIDWRAFARTGQPVVKLFRAEQDAVVRLLVDSSRSLERGEPTKLATARRLAAGLAYLALGEAERAQVFAFDAGLRAAHGPRRGRGAIGLITRELPVEPNGGTDIAQSIDQTLQRSVRPGLLVVLSDFLDPGPVVAAIGRARAAGHDVAMVQVLAPEEVEPPWEGDVELEDVESGERVQLTFDARAIEAYRRRLDGLFATLAGAARRFGASYARALSTEPAAAVLHRVVSRAIA